MNLIDMSLNLLQQGKHPIVQFTSNIEEIETYFDANMKAKLVQIQPHGDFVNLVFDTSEFYDFNLQLEKPLYFDKDGNATLTASEAGFNPKDADSKYHAPYHESFYVSLDDETIYFTFVN